MQNVVSLTMTCYYVIINVEQNRMSNLKITGDVICHSARYFRRQFKLLVRSVLFVKHVST